MTLHGKEKTENKRLIVSLKENGSFELDFEVTKEQVDESEITLFKKIYKQFIENDIKSLFYMGFVKMNTTYCFSKIPEDLQNQIED